jgi:hypothetical protein
MVQTVPESRLIRLSVPAESRFVRLARLMAAAVGSDTGFDVEGVEDLRIAVNELFALLIEEAEDSTASVELIFTIDATGVEVEGVRRDAEPIAGPEELALEILEVVVDEHSFDTEDGARRFRLRKQVPVT